jgi:hypothetical protein
LCFSYDYDEGLYNEFKDSDACLVIHNVKEFANRLTAAFAEEMLSHLAFDGRVAYGNQQSPFGVLFSKPKSYIYQREYRFLWIPENPQQHRMVDPMTIINENIDKIQSIIPPHVDIYVGSLHDITSLKTKS